MEYNQIKKGNTIYEMSPWNFIAFNVFRNNDQRNLVTGKTEINVIKQDEVRITEWMVHSIGPKIMRLVSTDGRMAKRNIYSQWFVAEERWFSTKEEATQAGEKFYTADPNRRPTLVFVDKFF